MLLQNIKKRYFTLLCIVLVMADDKKALSKNASDNWFKKLEGWFTKKFFVAGIFFLFGIGAVFGAIIATGNNQWLLIVPFALGLLAYYSRDFALVALVLFALVFFII